MSAISLVKLDDRVAEWHEGGIHGEWLGEVKYQWAVGCRDEHRGRNPELQASSPDHNNQSFSAMAMATVFLEQTMNKC